MTTNKKAVFANLDWFLRTNVQKRWLLNLTPFYLVRNQNFKSKFDNEEKQILTQEKTKIKWPTLRHAHILWDLAYETSKVCNWIRYKG